MNDADFYDHQPFIDDAIGRAYRELRAEMRRHNLNPGVTPDPAFDAYILRSIRELKDRLSLLESDRHSQEPS